MLKDREHLWVTFKGITSWSHNQEDFRAEFNRNLEIVKSYLSQSKRAKNCFLRGMFLEKLPLKACFLGCKTLKSLIRMEKEIAWSTFQVFYQERIFPVEILRVVGFLPPTNWHRLLALPYICIRCLSYPTLTGAIRLIQLRDSPVTHLTLPRWWRVQWHNRSQAY